MELRLAPIGKSGFQIANSSSEFHFFAVHPISSSQTGLRIRRAQHFWMADIQSMAAQPRLRLHCILLHRCPRPTDTGTADGTENPEPESELGTTASESSVSSSFSTSSSSTTIDTSPSTVLLTSAVTITQTATVTSPGSILSTQAITTVLTTIVAQNSSLSMPTSPASLTIAPPVSSMPSMPYSSASDPTDLAMLAPLSQTSTTPPSTYKTQIILSITLGAVVALILALVAVYLLWRRRKRRREDALIRDHPDLKPVGSPCSSITGVVTVSS